MKAVLESDQMVYALVAPAFIGQFSPQVTPGMLRSAFRRIGFDGMVEVAIFADILTLKEALEFDRNIKTESEFSADQLLLSHVDWDDPKKFIIS